MTVKIRTGDSSWMKCAQLLVNKKELQEINLVTL